MNKINLSPEARRRLQNERRRMARESGKRAEREFDSAIGSVRTQERTHASNMERTYSIALLRNILSLCRAVNASFGVSVPVTITPVEVPNYRNPNWSPKEWESAQSLAVGISGRTDMTNIEVTYPLWRHPDNTPVYSTDTGYLMSLVSDIKALQYHELGHVLYTQPIRRLLSAIVSDEWLSKNPELGYPNASSVGGSLTSIQRSWNILEDQRMETALVCESPYIARYFTKLVLRFILSATWSDHQTMGSSEYGNALQYFLVINRRYLPVGIRAKSRELAVGVLGEEIVKEAEALVRGYCLATTDEGIVLHTLLFHNLLLRLGVTPPKMDDHPSYGTPRNGAESSADSKGEQSKDSQLLSGFSKKKEAGSEDGDQPKGTGKSEDKNKSDDKSDDKSEGKSEGTAPSDDKSEGKSDDKSDDKSEGEQEDSDKNGGSGAGNGDHSPSTASSVNDEALKALEDIENQLSRDSDIEETVRAINEDLNRDGSTLLSPETGTGALLTGGLLSQAEEIGIRLSQSFDSAVSSALPVWEEGHRNGVVNAFRYRTRATGDHNYRRMLSSDGNTGLDITVSLLLDVSGSMSPYEAELSSVAYAVKSACDRVDISCAVLTFNGTSRELYRKDERFVVPLMLSAGGGTTPTEALQVLDSHRDNQKYHLVIILTDGVWHSSVAESIRGQYQDGRVFLGISLGGEYLANMGFHSTVSISNLETMPEIVRDFLLNFLG